MTIRPLVDLAAKAVPSGEKAALEGCLNGWLFERVARSTMSMTTTFRPTQAIRRPSSERDAAKAMGNFMPVDAMSHHRLLQA